MRAMPIGIVFHPLWRQAVIPPTLTHHLGIVILLQKTEFS